jgi:hypothetical protein
MNKYDLSTVTDLSIANMVVELQRLNLMHLASSGSTAAIYLCHCQYAQVSGDGGNEPLIMRKHLFKTDGFTTGRSTSFVDIGAVHNLLAFGEAIIAEFGHREYFECSELKESTLQKMLNIVDKLYPDRHVHRSEHFTAN